MSDKEPRRRKKRKDQPKKDDLQFEETTYVPQKQESSRGDSDQEAEDDHYVATQHQPSKIAKIVFMLLFSALVVTMSIVFISLRGAERGPVDIFEMDHHDQHVEVEGTHEEDVEVWTVSEQDVDQHHEETHLKESIEPLEVTEAPDQEEELISSVFYKSEENADEISLETVTETYDEGQSEATQSWHEDIEEEVLVEDDGSSKATTFLPDTNEDEVEESKSEVVVESSPPEQEQYHFSYEELTEKELTEEIPEPEVKTEPPITEQFDAEESSENYDPDYDSSPMGDVDSEDASVQEDAETDTYMAEDVDAGPQVYTKQDITNEEDYQIKEELDDIDSMLDKSPDKALLKYENILRLYPYSPRALYGKSQALDKLAESQRSNSLLEQAIASYQAVMRIEKVPDKLYVLSGTRSVDRMRFRGFVGKALKLQVEMMNRYPNNTEIKKHVGVGYLLIGQNREAKKLFMEVLEQNPNDGFSKVHLGFILKTDENKYEEAVKLMADGIASKEEGVIDGRFFLHLGDALARTGKELEAMKIYEEGAKEGLFLSAYQRSLYNVKGLTGKPWWDPMKTPYSKFIQLLENNWIAIKNEALFLLDDRQAGFLPESEGLQDTGDWKQYELFTRGKKHPQNCNRSPRTCALVEQMPDAAGCKRGQVKFSIMQAGTHVWAHCGPTNCRLRSHLGLVVPPGAKIRVANETKVWTEGKVLMFDDSYEHEVWHEGKSLRLVLIVDFWHPDLTVYQKSTLTPI